MFALRSISAKLTIFYAALLAGALGFALFGAQRGIEHHAENVIAREMTASAAVFDRILTMRSQQLGEAAAVTASDFGFREAVALGDRATMLSALDNLKNRLDLPFAFIATLEGELIGAGGAIPTGEREAIWTAIDGGSQGGVLTINDQAFGTVVSEIRTPDLAGWVVFGYRADDEALASLAGMGSLDVSARIVDRASLAPAFRDIALEDARPYEVTEGGERLLVSANPLDSLVEGRDPVLLLRYSLSAALAGYGPMLWSLALIGGVTLLLTLAGSFLLARHISRPIKALAAATQRVSGGDHAEVKVDSRDEIGELAQSFNRMVVAIAERERQISHLAFHDALTGLPNRALFREQLDQSLRRKDGDGGCAVLCIDLDNFKSVNDTLGHAVGDRLLGAIAAAYREALDGETIARLSADEFAAIVHGDGEAIEAKVRAIIAASARNFEIDGHAIATGASIGVAIARQDGDSADMLLKNATLALHRAKEEGKGSYRFFEPRMDAQAQERRQLEIDLREALDRGEFELHFQPLFCLNTNRVSSFEALLRWNHPTRGLTPPAEFIPLAEATGLIVPIGEWVLHEACRIAATWDEPLPVAVNVSAVQFRNPGLVSVVFQALARSGIAPGRLELEITESLFIENAAETIEMLHQVHRLGVRIALDDFGTGYSSLAYLRRFPFDKIKIDRSFIVDLLTSDGASAIVRSITALAAALGMETTAEGVEESGQVDVLRAQGCTHIQGFLFSKPVAASEVPKLIGAIGERRAA
ncbi:MAG: EAL domain-containing protein [Sphingomonadaceae bacterium]|nr:EAL domain-containing protein [Sphingomonadaceae bacterium]